VEVRPGGINLPPAGNETFSLPLREIWTQAEMDKVRGTLGFLAIDVRYKGELIDDVLVQL
jgi:hypothetical protein